MILVFGGTTEGRRAIKALEAAGQPYFYSTKTGEQEVSMVHGRRTDGAMNAGEMARFCQKNDIRLIVDAAHPFASRLHQAIADVAAMLNLPVVRFERIYPPRDPDIVWIDDYRELSSLLPPHSTLLATTGVQSIARLRWLEERGVRVLYRILNRESSLRMAREAFPDGLTVMDGDAMGLPLPATEEYLWVSRNCPPPSQGGDGGGSADNTFLLLKESGLSGGFPEKVAAARQRGMKIIALRRPPLPFTLHPSSFTLHPSLFTSYTVDGEYGLRRAVEHILPDFYPLKSGLTTGTCATAAAVAAILHPSSFTLHPSPFTLHPSLPSEVPVRLPNGETIFVPVHYGDGYAYVLKESGDDPDVTNGIEVRASLCPPPREGGKPISSGLLPLRLGLPGIEVYAGEGIGRFTLPGFDYPPGEPAVNRVPREMLRDNIASMLAQLSIFRSALPLGLSKNFQFSIVLSIPDGASIARRTFNPRLGIEGGISVIGVSGIVMPYSEEAFIQSIHKCMTVAKASGSPRIVVGSGMKSHEQLRRLYPDLPPQAFVEYGNYIGATLKIADEMGINRVTLGIMIGKAVKLAQGHLDTHSRRATMDKAFVQQLLDEAKADYEIQNSKLTVARELWGILSPAEARRFTDVVIAHCRRHCAPLLPNGELTILLLRNEE